MNSGWLLMAMIGVQGLLVVIYLTLVRGNVIRGKVVRKNVASDKSADGNLKQKDRDANNRIGNHAAVPTESFRLERPARGGSDSASMADAALATDANGSGDTVPDQHEAVADSREQLESDSSTPAMEDSLPAGECDNQPSSSVSHLERYRDLRHKQRHFWFSCDSQVAGTVGFCPTSVTGKPHLVTAYMAANCKLGEIVADCIRDADSKTLNLIVGETCTAALSYLLHATFVVMQSRNQMTSFPEHGFNQVLTTNCNVATVDGILKEVSVLMTLAAFNEGSLEARNPNQPNNFFLSIFFAANTVRMKHPKYSYPIFVSLYVAQDRRTESTMRHFEDRLAHLARQRPDQVVPKPKVPAETN